MEISKVQKRILKNQGKKLIDGKAKKNKRFDENSTDETIFIVFIVGMAIIVAIAKFLSKH